MSMTPSPRTPGQGQSGVAEVLEAIQQLRSHFDARLDRVDARMNGFDERQRMVEIGLAEVKGRIDGVDKRIGELSARVPNIWTIAALIVALFGSAFALLRFGPPHGM